MNTGKSLTELAQEIERQRETKKDVVVDTRLLTMLPSVGGQAPQLRLPAEAGRDEDQGFPTNINGPTLPLTPLAARQITDRAGIPAKFADKLSDVAPGLLAHNVNELFRVAPERRMVRMLEGKARAFLSDRYQRIDNMDVAQTVLPILGEDKSLKVVSCEITEKKMYIKAVTERVKGEVKVGDEVQAGVVISNSEIGFGALSVQPLIFRLVCLNGMIVPDNSFRKHHVGARAGAGEGIYHLLSDEALKADDNAIMLKVRDVVRASMDQAVFDATLRRMKDATEQMIEGNPVKAMEVLSDRLALNKDEEGGVLRHLIDGGDLSRWGVLNAVTRSAQDTDDYDRATELEAAGGKVLDLSSTEWKIISEAA